METEAIQLENNGTVSPIIQNYSQVQARFDRPGSETRNSPNKVETREPELEPFVESMLILDRDFDESSGSRSDSRSSHQNKSRLLPTITTTKAIEDPEIKHDFEINALISDRLNSARSNVARSNKSTPRSQTSPIQEPVNLIRTSDLVQTEHVSAKGFDRAQSAKSSQSRLASQTMSINSQIVPREDNQSPRKNSPQQVENEKKSNDEAPETTAVSREEVDLAQHQSDNYDLATSNQSSFLSRKSFNLVDDNTLVDPNETDEEQATVDSVRFSELAETKADDLKPTDLKLEKSEEHHHHHESLKALSFDSKEQSEIAEIAEIESEKRRSDRATDSTCNHNKT